jgi:hypothetical protein
MFQPRHVELSELIFEIQACYDAHTLCQRLPQRCNIGLVGSGECVQQYEAILAIPTKDGVSIEGYVPKGKARLLYMLLIIVSGLFCMMEAVFLSVRVCGGGARNCWIDDDVVVVR